MAKERWSMIFSKTDFEAANNIFKQFKKAHGKLGILVEEPQWIDVPKV